MPWTVAVNESVPEVIEDAVVGDIVTEVTVGLGGELGAVGLALTCDELGLSPAEPTAETA